MSIDESAWGVLQRAAGAAYARWFSGTNTSQVAAMPTNWGQGHYWVEVCPRTQNLLYQFSDTSGARVGTCAASSTGTSGTTVPGLLLSGQMTHVKVPRGCTYFAYMTETGTTDVYMGLRSIPASTP